MGTIGECRPKSCGPLVTYHCAVMAVCKYPIIHMSREHFVSSHGIRNVKILEVEENSFWRRSLKN
jgi:hypothetical protein